MKRAGRSTKTGGSIEEEGGGGQLSQAARLAKLIAQVSPVDGQSLAALHATVLQQAPSSSTSSTVQSQIQRERKSYPITLNNKGYYQTSVVSPQLGPMNLDVSNSGGGISGLFDEWNHWIRKHLVDEKKSIKLDSKKGLGGEGVGSLLRSGNVTVLDLLLSGLPHIEAPVKGPRQRPTNNNNDD